MGHECEEQLSNHTRAEAIEFCCLAVLLVFASHAVPAFALAIVGNESNPFVASIGYRNASDLVALLFSTLLVVSRPRHFGIRFGDVKGKWPRLLALCIVPIALTAIVYPRLPVRPFEGDPIGTWLISPLAQDLLFAGYFYAKLDDYFPGSISKRLPLNRTVFLTAALFAIWHWPSFLGLDAGYAAFQQLYTFAGACFVGIIRQWTGSMIYITAIHMATNAIAVYA